MDPASLVPPLVTIPAPWGIFEALLLVTFTAHLLFMNVVLGGSIIALVTGGRYNTPAPALARTLPTTLALTVNLGVPPLLFLSVLFGGYLYVASVLSAVFWLTLVALAMAAYYLLYIYSYGIKTGMAPSQAITLAALLLLGVSFIMSNIMSLLQRPETWTAYLDTPGGTILNLGDPTFFPRWLHFVTASLAVGGLYVALTNARAATLGNKPAMAKKAMGLAWFTRATMVQIALGIWFLLALPTDIMLLFMGKSGLHTAVFLAGLAAVAAALIFGLRGQLGRTTIALVLTVALMVGMRDLVRAAYLGPYFHPEKLPVVPQYGPLAVFLISLAAVAGITWYMVSLYARSNGRA
ncbi:hypothetical protein [Desulfolutivibrio sulfoxidireducens]|uniref:hypothetical protein n=1 Tax=Desulfolutivibrio sulfoxidireducens TaxID=2773299 RepID=UPI00159E3EAE|nr:hypothetical protein [Desulfolutivibrio sulfoxidireducens]QLA19390.1 hypothetical protein GD604_06330 [Desulfolutivibrio sulfoxidireducens]